MHNSNSARESKDGMSAYRPGSRFALPLLPVLGDDDDDDDVLLPFLFLLLVPYRFLNSCICCRSNVLACVLDNMGAPPILPAQNASTKNIPALVNTASLSSLLLLLLYLFPARVSQLLLLIILILRGLSKSEPSMPSIGKDGGAVVAEASSSVTGSVGNGRSVGIGGEKAVENNNLYCCCNTMEAMPRRRTTLAVGRNLADLFVMVHRVILIFRGRQHNTELSVRHHHPPQPFLDEMDRHF